MPGCGSFIVQQGRKISKQVIEKYSTTSELCQVYESTEQDLVGERGLPGDLPDTRALGLSWAGSLEVEVLVWVPRKQPSMSGFEKSLLLWEGEEAPAAGEQGGDHQ